MRILFVEHPDGGGPGVFGDIAPMDRWRAWEEPPPALAYDALVLYGGADNVGTAPPWMRDEIAWLRSQLEAGVPALGLCLGAQLVAAALGAPVTRAATPEIGWLPAWLTDAGRDDPVLSVLGERFVACQWHSWTFGLPEGSSLLALSAACPQAFRDGRSVGVQFHPEVDEPTLARWIRDWRNDPDAVARGFDPAHAREEMAARLGGWNDAGRRLFAAWLEDVG